MESHIAILPTEFLDALTLSVDSTPSGCHTALPFGRFLRLPHPRTGIPSLFLPSSTPSKGSTSSTPAKQEILEVQAVSPANPRSWFMGEKVIADGKLLVLTRVDPAFLLIPIMQSVSPDDGTLGNFRPSDDIFEDAALKLETVSHSQKDPSLFVSAKDVTAFVSFETSKQALRHICDFKEVTSDIVVYRFSPAKVVEYCRTKVGRVSTPEVFETSRTLIRSLARDGLMEDGRESLLPNARIRASCDLIAQYLPSDLHTALRASYDFKELDEYLRKLEDERAPLATNTNNAKKDDTKNDKKRKPKASHSVEKLKKANVNGMSKLSSFFGKKG